MSESVRRTLIGTKVGMTRVIGDGGVVQTVTVVKAGPCVVLQVKTVDRDGYDAIQLGYGEVLPHRSTLPMIGHAAAAKTGPKRVVREVRLAEPASLSPGDVLTVEQFAGEGDGGEGKGGEGKLGYVDVVGTTKGKGFAGVMKRHGFGGQQATHGVERKHRSAGSIGGHASLGCGRGVKKGKKMAGHMGSVRRTASSLRLVGTDIENDLLIVAGSIPGANGSTVLIRQAKKRG